MKILLRQNGLTLAELLVTSIIIGVIMVGMVSVDYAVRSNEQQQSRTALVALKTSGAIKDIEQAVTQAFGDVSTRCVQLANLTTNSTNYICVYRDYGTPSNESDDGWQCYTRIGTNLHKCTRTIASGKGSCVATDLILGTVTEDTFDAPDTPQLVSSSLNLYFQITLKNRYDPSRPVPGVGASNPSAAVYSISLAQEFINNPKVKMTTRISPSGCVAS